MTKLIKTLAATTAALSLSCMVASAEIVIDEARFGGAIAQPEWTGQDREQDQWVVTAEVLFSPVNIDFLNVFEGNDSVLAQALVNPRPHIGGLFNFNSDGTSSLYTGLTWHFPMGDVFFLEATFGFGVNDGETETDPGSNRANLGSNILFRESIALGVNITETTTFTLQASHQSHANLAGDDNYGLTNFGGKLGFKF
ncbi:acyloxyacyl hydrolase [Pseudahrensia aquimaris]|uniref:Acyloxyacyl hydrolase n=1 Tax=Pseudahrensia aquimaris TaxID=744461 RepID=A0ABW3F9I8_9HYPH